MTDAADPAEAESGPLEFTCPRCTASHQLVCLNCNRPGPFGLNDAGAECACGVVIGYAFCACGAMVMPKFFGPPGSSPATGLPADLQLGRVQYACGLCGEASHLICTFCGDDTHLGLSEFALHCQCGAMFEVANCGCGAVLQRAQFSYMPGSGPPAAADAKSAVEPGPASAGPSTPEPPGMASSPPAAPTPSRPPPPLAQPTADADFGTQEPSKLSGAAVVIALLLGVGWCAGIMGGGSASDAEQAVKRRLKAPSSATFVETKSYGNGRFFVVVDAQNSFGAMLRQSYCVVLPGGDPNAPNREQVFECERMMADVMFKD